MYTTTNRDVCPRHLCNQLGQMLILEQYIMNAETVSKTFYVFLITITYLVHVAMYSMLLFIITCHSLLLFNHSGKRFGKANVKYILWKVIA